jgi:Domain of unknown function (DUF1835)/Protein of unknown function
MIHLVFEPSAAEALEKSFELDESLRGEIMVIRDDFAVGPIQDLDTEAGWESRLEWWRERLQYSPYTDVMGTFDDRKTVEQICDKLQLNADEKVWIWMGQNQHDVCGYYWLIPQLKEFQSRVFVLYLNNLPFINEKGQIFYPTHLVEIQPKEFLKAKKLSRPVTLSEFEIDPDEWNRLCNENATVRILEGGKKIAGKSADFYDKDLLANLTKDWQKASRVLHNTLHRMKNKTGDVFLMWRLRQLISQESLDVNGDMTKGWKDFELKIPGGTVVQEESI